MVFSCHPQSVFMCHPEDEVRRISIYGVRSVEILRFALNDEGDNTLGTTKQTLLSVDHANRDAQKPPK